MASARRSTAVALDFTPIRIDTSYYESNADMVGNMGSFNVAKERLTVSTNISAANQVASQKRTLSFARKNEEVGGSGSPSVITGGGQHLERGETDTRRIQISAAEREVHVHHLNGSSVGGGGLGSGSYRESEKSLGTQHNLTLNVMNTSHPARLVMQRSANRLLSKYVGVQPQTPRSRSVGPAARSDSTALSEFLEALRGLEPISMATSLVQRANVESMPPYTRSLPRRHVAGVMAAASANDELHRIGPTVTFPFHHQEGFGSQEPSSGLVETSSSAEGCLNAQPPAKGISVARRPLSARISCRTWSRNDNREKTTKCTGSFMRPTSASLAMSRGEHRQDDDVTDAAVEHRYVDRLAIGSAPNRFYLSSSPRDMSHVKALAHTVRPSDIATSRRDSSTAGDGEQSSNGPPQKPKRGFGVQQTIQDMYSAYCEPLVADAPLLFETSNASPGGTTDRSKGGVTTAAAAVAYVFSDRQSASPFALQLTRAEQAKTAHTSSSAPGLDAFHADVGKSDRVASTTDRVPCPPKRGSDFKSSAAGSTPRTCAIGIDPMKHLRAEDGTFAAPQTARGSFRSSFLERGRARSLSKQADTLLVTLPPGGVISKSARFRTSKPPPPPATSEREEGQSLPFDNILQKHVPAARFSSVPREAFSGSKSAENFKRRAPGPGAYAGAVMVGSRKHQRVGSFAACLNAGLV